ncbi:phage portal protein [Myroides pelagicus]|uniref:Phage portal protein n=1 Tax=Myroides pelagicus TaxID=270914 RepID=A0A7K1GHC9_9FLAO|nr:phage portal protein [Myroides pelagicus]MTH28411.1 phage portal protein [Myroides pelagicus]
MSGLLDSVFRPLESGSSSSGFFDLFPSFFKANGKTLATANTALMLPAFYNGVDQLSNDIAKLPKAVFLKEGESRKKLTDHPLNYLISTEPNEMMTAFDFWKLAVVLVILKGNCYVRVNRNSNGVEQSLVIQDNSDVVVKRSGDKLFYFIKGESHLSSDILHFKAFTLNGITGVSVIKWAAHNLGIALDSYEYASDIYSDRGLGYGVIESEKGVDTAAKKLISDGFTRKLAEKNKFKVPVLDEGLKYKPITVTPAEAQFLETNKNSVNEIARWLNIAPHKLKDLTNANYSNIQAQSIEHVQDSLLPWTIRIELELNRKMFSREDSEIKYVKFNEKVLLRGDSEARKNYLTQLVYAGIITRNEARALEDLDPIPGLDEPLTPVNSQLLDFMLKKNEKELKDE